MAITVSNKLTSSDLNVIRDLVETKCDEAEVTATGLPYLTAGTKVDDVWMNTIINKHNELVALSFESDVSAINVSESSVITPGDLVVARNQLEVMTFPPIIPAGLILPYNAAGSPAGWTFFDVGSNRSIIGAGNSYSAGDSNVTSTPPNFSGSTSTNGLHGPPSDKFIRPDTRNNRRQYNHPYNLYKGNHSHTYTFNFTPSQKTFRFHKANVDMRLLSPNIAILTNSDINPQRGISLTNVVSTERNLRAGSSISESDEAASNIITNTETTHFHEDTDGAYSYTPLGLNWGYQNYDAGDHNHTSASIIATGSLYRHTLNAWTNTTTDFYGNAGIIGMWDGASIPDKWYQCDGNNGTPDLRDRFIYIVNTGAGISTDGDNKLDYDITFSTKSHYHDGSIRYDAVYVSDEYHSENIGHEHTDSKLVDWIPLYYALTFIMRGSI